jgi:hypothetical protein
MGLHFACQIFTLSGDIWGAQWLKSMIPFPMRRVYVSTKTAEGARKPLPRATEHALGAHAPGQAAWGDVGVRPYRAGKSMGE